MIRYALALPFWLLAYAFAVPAILSVIIAKWINPRLEWP